MRKGTKVIKILNSNFYTELGLFMNDKDLYHKIKINGWLNDFFQKK